MPIESTITKVQFTTAVNVFTTKTVADDDFVANYIKMVQYYIENLQNSKDPRDHKCEMLDILQKNLKQALENPEETKAKWAEAVKANAISVRDIK